MSYLGRYRSRDSLEGIQHAFLGSTSPESRLADAAGRISSDRIESAGLWPTNQRTYYNDTRFYRFSGSEGQIRCKRVEEPQALTFIDSKVS